MPRRNDIDSILVIGAGPIIIGQACEFDYSGSQACKSLKEEGYRVILINSNPATIMTDKNMADKTYIEPVTPTIIEKIIDKEKPCAILPTIGGQTGLNCAIELAKKKVLEKHNIELIGANIQTIEKAENREKFKEAMTKIGIRTTKSGIAHSEDAAIEISNKIDFPIIIRSSFTLGGTGGSVAYNMEDFKILVRKGLELSIANEIIVEESILGWKEYELEVMCDANDNVVIICSIENLDPIGIHTGDSITVAPQQTLSDIEYQKLRNYTIAIIREIGVRTGGANVQFAVNPKNGNIIVIEMNPRVSRSSALASKATGFPIAKIAAKLAVGYTLDEIKNDITKTTPSSFEPSIDYVVTKIPRFAFEKFSSSKPQLGIQMQSVGESMGIGRTFKESFQKTVRSLDINKNGFEGHFFNYYFIFAALLKGINLFDDIESLFQENWVKKHLLSSIKDINKEIDYRLKSNDANRIFYIKDAFMMGYNIDDIYKMTFIDKWFLNHLYQIYELDKKLFCQKIKSFNQLDWQYIKQLGHSDFQIASLVLTQEIENNILLKSQVDEVQKFNEFKKTIQNQEKLINQFRKDQKVTAVYKLVDTCAGEFEAQTPYYYSTYDQENEIKYYMKDNTQKRIMILGGGPNRIGQGIEFDYMCVKASLALQDKGYESIMVNSNPETVSTDYDISSHLFFEPIAGEDILGLIHEIKPDGIIVQLGGQTPLNLSDVIEQSGCPILGTSSKAIALAEDREQFKGLLEKLNLKQPYNSIASSIDQATEEAQKLGFPLVVRPSFVLGGRSMSIIYDELELKEYLYTTFKNFNEEIIILLDRYLENAIELDVDCISDGENFVVCNILEHVEEAGIHSGDSACICPSQNISKSTLKKVYEQSKLIAKELHVKGFLNIQFALKEDDIYFLEVNPRGSRTIPFISKATNIPWVDIAIYIMLGDCLKDYIDIDHWYEEIINSRSTPYVSIKEAVLPFDKFPEEDLILGPEMKSTGEVMGIGKSIGEAFLKTQLATNIPLPSSGGILITVNTKCKPNIINISRQLIKMGFHLYTTQGTYNYLQQNGIESTMIEKLNEGRPNIRDIILDKKVQMIFNTPLGKQAKKNDKYIRLLAKQNRIPIFTTISGMQIATKAIKYLQSESFSVCSLQEYYQKLKISAILCDH